MTTDKRRSSIASLSPSSTQPTEEGEDKKLPRAFPRRKAQTVVPIRRKALPIIDSTECHHIPFAFTYGAREIAAQALSSLMFISHNCREVKKDEKSVPNLIQLLDPSPQNTAKKYAVLCLGLLSSSKKCKKLMISYGAIGYLKKLSEMEIPGAKKLLERLERGELKSLFSRK